MDFPQFYCFPNDPYSVLNGVFFSIDLDDNANYAILI